MSGHHSICWGWAPGICPLKNLPGDFHAQWFFKPPKEKHGLRDTPTVLSPPYPAVSHLVRQGLFPSQDPIHRSLCIHSKGSTLLQFLLTGVLLISHRFLPRLSHSNPPFPAHPPGPPPGSSFTFLYLRPPGAFFTLNATADMKGHS